MTLDQLNESTDSAQAIVESLFEQCDSHDADLIQMQSEAIDSTFYLIEELAQ